MPMGTVNIQWRVLDAVLILSLLVELTEQPTGSHAADIWKWILREAGWARAAAHVALSGFHGGIQIGHAAQACAQSALHAGFRGSDGFHGTGLAGFPAPAHSILLLPLLQASRDLAARLMKAAEHCDQESGHVRLFPA